MRPKTFVTMTHVLSLTTGLLGCRPDTPQEPRIPPNSPLPTVDRPEEPKTFPTPAKDAGVTAPSSGGSNATPSPTR